MKKKSLLTMVLALALVGAVGIGATLAYLSDKTEVMTNTFTVGNVDITQDEVIYDYDKDDDGKVDPEYDEDGDGKVDEGKERTEEGNDYTDIQPGDTLVKDPTVTVVKGSVECYVFMRLDGADELAAQGFTFNELGADGAWAKCDGTTGLDGLYKYSTTVNAADATDNVKLASLFTSVTYDIEAPEVPENGLSEVIIKSCAVQVKNMDITKAIEEAAVLTAITVTE